MSKNALKAFIREALVIAENDDLSWANDPDLEGPRGGSFSSLVPFMKDEKGSLLLKKFAIQEGGDPAVVVVSQNANMSKLILRDYSRSKHTSNQVESAFGAKLIDGNDPIIDQIVNEQDGWETDYTLGRELFNLKRRILPGVSKLDVNHYIAPINYVKLKRPNFVATSQAQQDILNFKCTSMSVESAVETIFTKSPKTPEWALAAACFYSYAQSGNQMVASLVAGTAIGAVTGGLPGAGTGFVAGLVWPDIILRLPVILWAHAMGETSIRNANLGYCAILLLFEGFDKFLRAKMLAKAGKVAAETTRALTAWGEKIFPFVTNGKMSQETYHLITAGVDDLASTTTTWWTSLAWWIASVAASLGAAIGVDVDIQETSKQVYGMLTGEVDIAAIEGSSRAKMIQELTSRYPTY